jgi:hypothetical protein
LRTYCNAAASTSSWVAGGSRPRNMVMFRHMSHGTSGRIGRPQCRRSPALSRRRRSRWPGTPVGQPV